MAETVISSGSALAVKLYSVSLHAETQKRSAFATMMMGKLSTQQMANAKREKVQTTPDMPVVMITDLQQMAGDTVSCDMVNMVQGLPFMGDEEMEGRGQSLTFSSMEVKINQMRFPIKPGARMQQKRTKHNLRMTARAEMASWFARTNDQIMQVHMAGARGDENTNDWNVPVDTHPRFRTIMINPVRPPTSNRYFVAGGASGPDGAGVDDIGLNDVLTLTDLDVLQTVLRDMTYPPAPIKVASGFEGDELPIYCIMVTERQWHYMSVSANPGSSNWRKFLADATKRLMTTKHPIFTGDCGMWAGFLIKRQPRAIRFQPGSTVMTVNADTGAAVSKTVQAGVIVDRAIGLGGQAIAFAKGDSGSGQGGYPMKWTEKLLDHDNATEIGAGQICGVSKFYFTGSDGKITDFGTFVIDSYAPDPQSAAGETLRTLLDNGRPT